MTDERVEPTKEPFDEVFRRLNFWAQDVAHRLMADDIRAELTDALAILASQPERVECPNGENHKVNRHANVGRGMNRDDPHNIVDDEFCSRCGQSLKGDTGA